MPNTVVMLMAGAQGLGTFNLGCTQVDLLMDKSFEIGNASSVLQKRKLRYVVVEKGARVTKLPQVRAMQRTGSSS
jgi:hypothetical protein